MKKYPKESGIVLKRMRENHGRSVVDVASGLKISAPYLYRLEKGNCRPPAGELLRKMLLLYGDVKEKSFFESVRREKKPKPESPVSRPNRRQHRVIITPESQALRHLRKRAGYSIRAASEALGFSGDGAYVSQIENGRVNAPRGERLGRFLEVYGSSGGEFESLKASVGSEELSLRKAKRLFEDLSDKNRFLVMKLMEAIGSRA